MKKILSIFITIALIFSTTPMIAVAEVEEENKISTEEPAIVEQTDNEVVEQPQIPIINDTMTEDEANQLIDEYNSEVDQYNNYVTEENNRRGEEQQQIIKEIDEHNTQEQLKVEENNKQLEKQEKLEQKVAADSQPKTENYTTKPEEIPSSWTDNTEAPKTISVVQGETSDETYKVTNLHIYVDEETEDTYTGTQVNDENFFVNLATKNHLVFGEWETITVGKNDLVTVSSQSSLFPHSGAVFLRRLEGYTNGYWLSTQEFVSTTKYNNEVWTVAGPSTEFSYKDGTVDRQPIKNVLNIFTYNFLRYGAEPTKIKQYIPDYWEYPTDQAQYLDYLTKLDRISRPTPATAESPVQEEEKPISEPTPETKTTPTEKVPVENPSIESGPNILENITPIVTTPTEENIPVTNAAPVVNIVLGDGALPVGTAAIVTPLIGQDNVDLPIANVTTATGEDNIPVLKTQNEVTLEENENPLAKPEDIALVEKWALLNLILMIITMLFAIKVPKEENEKEDVEIKRHSNIIPILTAIVSALVFIFTENVRLPMTIIDKYTILMAIITLFSGISLFLTKDKEVENK